MHIKLAGGVNWPKPRSHNTFASKSSIHLELPPRPFCLAPMMAMHAYRNGPGQFELGSMKVAHPFDGHGIVSSICIKDGKAFFRSKFVRSFE